MVTPTKEIGIVISFCKEGKIKVKGGCLQKSEYFEAGEGFKAIVFACTLLKKTRDKPCLTIPPNLLNSVPLGSSTWEVRNKLVTEVSHRLQSVVH